MAASDEIRLTTEWVVGAVGGARVSGSVDREFGGVSIDTRTLAAGDLFIAIRGERFDGADFIDAAVAAGAGGAVVPRGRAGNAVASGATVIEVDDTVAALQALARAIRRAAGTKVVAVTGSAGKTTTKEVTGEFLAARYHVIRNRGNFNNHVGLPLSLIELRRRPDIAVVELGMNHAGEIRTLVRIAEPDIRVWTNVGEAHLGFFPSIDAIAEAKAEIFEGAGDGTVLVANADDERIMRRIPGFAGKVITFGIEQRADVRATDVVARGIDGVSARVTTPGGAFDLDTPLIGRANLSNILAAAAVAVECGIALGDIAGRASHLRPAPRRGDVLRLGRDITVIDDSYNANPTATIRAMELVGGTASASRRVAVLGEMLELGEQAVALHEDVGRAAARLGIDLLLTVGGAPAVAMAAAARSAGLDRACARHFPTSDVVADAIVSLVRPGDLVLVKGSRGIRTDRIVDRLKAELA